jgi:hypothetical protein
MEDLMIAVRVYLLLRYFKLLDRTAEHQLPAQV